MAGVFSTFGEEIRNSLNNFAESVSAAVISDITPIVMTGILIFFTLRAWQISSGRWEGSMVGLIESCFKITLVAFFALNVANFTTLVIPAVYGVESMLLSSVSSAIGGGVVDSAWNAIDQVWFSFTEGLTQFSNLWSKLSVSPWGDSITAVFFIGVMYLFMAFTAAYFMIFAVGYLLLYEIFLVMGLAFGPLFICCLMFQTTRSWFDGWLRAVICWAFTLVSVVAALFLSMSVLQTNISTVVEATLEAQALKNFSDLGFRVVIFIIIAFSIATVVRSIPSFAAALTGGVALQAASFAGMMSGVGHMMAAAVGGGMLGYASATQNDALREKAKNVLGSGGLTQPGAFASASLGYSLGGASSLAGKAASIFRGNDAPPSDTTTVSPHMNPTIQESQRASQNASAVGASAAAESLRAEAQIQAQAQAQATQNQGVSGAQRVAAGNAPSAVPPVSANGSAPVSGATDSSSASVLPTPPPTANPTVQSPRTTDFVNPSGVSGPAPTNSGSDFSNDTRRFNLGEGFTDQESFFRQSPQSTPSAPTAQELAEEARAEDNRRKIDEILKNKGKTQ